MIGVLIILDMSFGIRFQFEMQWCFFCDHICLLSPKQSFPLTLIKGILDKMVYVLALCGNRTCLMQDNLQLALVVLVMYCQNNDPEICLTLLFQFNVVKLQYYFPHPKSCGISLGGSSVFSQVKMSNMDEKYQFVVKEWQNIDRHIQLFVWLYSLPLSVFYQVRCLFHKY